MRAVVIVVLLIIVFVLIGWLTFSFTSNSASVKINPEKIQSDTENVVEEGKELLHDVGKSIDRTVD